MQRFANDAAARINTLTQAVFASYDATLRVLTIDAPRGVRFVPVCMLHGTVDDDDVKGALYELFPRHPYGSRYLG